MNLYTQIKQLADENHITIAELERATGISNGQIRKWNSRSPKVENLQKIADYFNVSVDFLLGRTKTRSFTAADELDIQATVKNMIAGLSNKGALAFMKNGGEEMDETEAELLRSSLEVVARESLILSRQRAEKNNE
ncbi:helix-turn-helix domain-containing protein [Levilactobacillus lanxiensis]|uniref:Helix-turn-helix domain-containing protein n=1 Tax=Levilactobacillus lanxiensis TaxID=2799568 RepID=A0ABW4D3N4_9LACO|nr:helix-turn-helix transcriptional regulator [Levilactobacillus lanxiensis]